MDFSFIDRGFDKTLVVLPGWAFDHKIFPIRGLGYNIISPSSPLCGDVSTALLKLILGKGLGEVDILGWSLGSVCAYLFAKEHQELVRNLFLISARNSYPKTMISELTSEIVKDKDAALKRFYLTSFYSQREDYRWFRKLHMKRLLGLWSTTKLIKGLNFLLQYPIKPYNFTDINLLIIHGAEDLVAPLSFVPSVTSKQKFKKFVLDSSGHVPFLNPSFHEIIENF